LITRRAKASSAKLELQPAVVAQKNYIRLKKIESFPQPYEKKK
jgi:hypothetical protein